MDRAPPQIREETEEVKTPETGRITPSTLGVGAEALPVGTPQVEDPLGLLDLLEVVETEEMTILGEVQSFARCANNSDTVVHRNSGAARAPTTNLRIARDTGKKWH